MDALSRGFTVNINGEELCPSSSSNDKITLKSSLKSSNNNSRDLLSKFDYDSGATTSTPIYENIRYPMYPHPSLPHILQRNIIDANR